MPTTRSSTRTRGSRQAGKAQNAVALLKADHREVEAMFEKFQKSRSQSVKAKLAASICMALKAHTRIEEEIFYPAFLEQAGEEDIHHEALVEHEGAKRLIAQIESSDASHEYFDAKVKVLSEMIKHHVKEEEKPGGMFAEAKKAGMDLEELGQRLLERKQQLLGRQ